MFHLFLVYLVSSIGLAVGSSCWIPLLCTPLVGYSLTALNTTIAIAVSSPCNISIDRSDECLLCGQISSSKHIDCRVRRIAGDNNPIALQYGGEQVGFQDISIQLLTPDALSDHIHPNISTSRYYISPVGKVDFYRLVNISSPMFGSIAANDLFIQLSHQQLQADNLREIQVEFDVMGIIYSVYTGQLGHLASSGIEPGSWFYTVTPVSVGEPGEVQQRGLPSHGYIEFVLHEEDIRKNRRFVEHQLEGQALHSVEAAISAHRALQPTAPRVGNKEALVDTTGPIGVTSLEDDRVHVCVWSSNTMDGQKRIWLQQIEHLDPQRFRFTWLLTLMDGQTLAEELAVRNVKPSVLSVANKLFARNRNGRVIDSPFNGIAIDKDALSSDPGDGRRPVSEIWNGEELALYRYDARYDCDQN